jgi:hypothetical protein
MQSVYQRWNIQQWYSAAELLRAPGRHGARALSGGSSCAYDARPDTAAALPKATKKRGTAKSGHRVMLVAASQRAFAATRSDANVQHSHQQLLLVHAPLLLTCCTIAVPCPAPELPCSGYARCNHHPA